MTRTASHLKALKETLLTLIRTASESHLKEGSTDNDSDCSKGSTGKDSECRPPECPQWREGWSKCAGAPGPPNLDDQTH